MSIPIIMKKQTHKRLKTIVEVCVGQSVYIPDEAAVWRHGVVQSVKGDKCEVKLHISQVVKVLMAEVMPTSHVDLLSINNLTCLSPLNPATVLETVERRYMAGNYYTSTGSAMVAVNPYQPVSQLYSLPTILLYSNGEQELPPHIYSIGEVAFRELSSEADGRNQTIVVSGESGAGKTVTAKHLLKYLAIRAHPESHRLSLCYSSVENKILDSNPILEAFGNASTPRNENSSRFGKYIQLQFNSCMSVVGASINTYLLEKTRVAHQADTDCNFHIFYQIVEGMSSGCVSVPGVSPRDLQFRILPQANCQSEDTERYGHTGWKQTQAALDDVGLCDSLQQALVQLLVGILFLGNVEFVPEDEDTCAISQLSASTEGLSTSAQLLGLDPSRLEKLFLFRNIQSSSRKRRSIFVKAQSRREAESRRDCLLMLLYYRLFDWLVGFINSKITCADSRSCIGLLDIYGFESFENNSLEQLCINYANERLQQHYIHHFLKDIQLDYEREGLQWERTDFRDNLAIVHLLDGNPSVFGVLNEEVYLNRDCDPVSLRDRIVSLTSECARPGRDRSKRKLQSEFQFSVQHYAGEVNYCVSNMVEKNRDNIPAEFSDMLQASSLPLVSCLFVNGDSEGSSSGRKRKSVLVKFKVLNSPCSSLLLSVLSSWHRSLDTNAELCLCNTLLPQLEINVFSNSMKWLVFQTSLDELMSEVSGSHVQYIRCIRPNRSSTPKVIDRPYVAEQLAASGILETVEVCRRGHGVRLPYQCFLRRFSPLLTCAYSNGSSSTKRSEEDKENQHVLGGQGSLEVKSSTPSKRRRLKDEMSDEQQVCQAILRSALPTHASTGHLFGTSKLFLKEYQWNELESVRLRLLSWCVRRVQRWWRCQRSRRALQERVREKDRAARLLQRGMNPPQQ
ncbi:unconventional myosin-XIX-like [Liolophura sinensis]|uniref:unconventional myosin-XIX-like n=1 Tax=Liolophura sinensis TaxID=3198878 RepID=UPI0031589790